MTPVVVSENDRLPQRLAIREVRQTDTATYVEVGERIHQLPPHLYLGAGDEVEIEASPEGGIARMFKIIYDGLEQCEHRIAVFPPYSVTEELFVPPHVLTVTFTERTNPEDWKQARLLEKFHYRGMGLNRIVGRRSVLLAKLRGFGLAGYGVVSASLAAAGPRFKLLETNLGQLMRTKLINKLVRIPRIVIHPEFRGLGLGALMARHLVEYVRERWDIRGYKPVLVEVIAAMTEYHRFFETAGFTKLGYTQGYEGLAIMPQYGKGSFAKRQNPERYHFMVDQKRKPYLVFPLTSDMAERVRRLQAEAGPGKHILVRSPLLAEPIVLRNVSVEYRSQDGLTPRAEQIKESFGVDSCQMYSPVVRKLTLTIKPGDTVLLTGASGSGKSTVVKLLTEPKNVTRRQMRIDGFWRSALRKTAMLDRKFDNSRPLVNQVGTDLHEAISILNGVGLAEAHLYLKRPRQISEGQRYRFAVALLCDSGKPVWIADEFASTLDPLTAAIAAKGLRKLAYRRGTTLILAAAHIHNFLGSLLPNVLVTLRWGGLADIVALRVSVRKIENRWSVRVYNSGFRELTGVRIGAVDAAGRFYALGALDALRHAETSVFVLDPAVLERYVALQVRTANGVGEVFYLDAKP